MIPIQKIDAVLPLILKDYERFKILYKSVKKNFMDLGTFWVVVCDEEYQELKSLIQDEQFKVIKESDLVPEFGLIETEISFWKVPGWYKQQLIKIAIAERVKTDFYITFDSDVICVKPVRYSDIVKDGRVECYLHPASKKWYVWYEWAERVLRLPHVSGLFHDFTPAILSKQGMLSMKEYLNKLASQGPQLPLQPRVNKKELLFLWAKVLLILKGKSSLCPLLNSWRGYLIKSLPWTEYSLYYTYLEAQNLFEKFHILKQDHRLYTFENSVWNLEYWENWKPQKAFNEKENYYFCIVQSNIGVSADKVWDKVQPYLS